MATFCYVCKKCGVAVEYDRLLEEGTIHIKERKLTGKGSVDVTTCGVLRRDWKAGAVNVNKTNLRGH